MARHGSVEAITKYFTYDHLPERLQRVSQPFSDLVTVLLNEIPVDSPELSVGLRKLLEAKDAFVRAALEK